MLLDVVWDVKNGIRGEGKFRRSDLNINSVYSGVFVGSFDCIVDIFGDLAYLMLECGVILFCVNEIFID